MRKVLVITLIVVVLALAYAAVKTDLLTLPGKNGGNTDGNDTLESGSEPGSDTASEIRTASLVSVGGMYPHDVNLNEAYLGGGNYDFSPTFEYIAPYFQAADIAMVNLETMQAGPDINYMGVSGYTGHVVEDIFTFNAPIELSKALKEAGVNMYVAANNHSMDRGLSGLKATLENVRDLGFITTGAYLSREERDTPDLIDINGIKVAFISYTFSTNGLPIPEGHEYSVNFAPFFEDISPVIADIESARAAGADIVTVLPHWGDEYVHEPTQRVRDIARELAEAGADIVLGGHPHVLQPLEWIYVENRDGSTRPTLVVYSTGNFFSNQHYPALDTDMVEYGLLLNIELAKNVDDGSAWINEVNYEIFWSHFAWRHRLLVLSEVFEQGPERYNISTSRLETLKDRYRKNMGIVELYGFSENKPAYMSNRN
ncbi:MAG: CapA family protein [Bacillota bacterium]